MSSRVAVAGQEPERLVADCPGKATTVAAVHSATPASISSNRLGRLHAAHPQATYFHVGRIGDDPIADWVRRMAMEEAEARRGQVVIV